MTFAFLYVFMATLFVAMAVSLAVDVRRNHYEHRAFRPLVLWIALMLFAQALHFTMLAVARFYRESVGGVWPVLDGFMWLVVLFFLAISVVGFYATFRTARLRENEERKHNSWTLALNWFRKKKDAAPKDGE